MLSSFFVITSAANSSHDCKLKRCKFAGDERSLYNRERYAQRNVITTVWQACNQNCYAGLPFGFVCEMGMNARKWKKQKMQLKLKRFLFSPKHFEMQKQFNLKLMNVLLYTLECIRMEVNNFLLLLFEKIYEMNFRKIKLNEV